MTQQELVAAAKGIIADILYITIASITPDGEPWNTPVYSSYDERYNFFWVSSPESIHSRNIAVNKNIFLAIYDSRVVEGTGRGVYIRAIAQELTDKEEIIKALAFAYGRKNKSPRPAEDFMGAQPRRVYKAVPVQSWINDDVKVGSHHVDTRVEIKLL